MDRLPEDRVHAALGKRVGIFERLGAGRQQDERCLGVPLVGTGLKHVFGHIPEAYGTNINVLIATGLMLFAITLVVNTIARIIVNRRKAFSGAN